MQAFNLGEHSHRRYNILTGEWVLVSPHRTKRPWQGKIEKVEEAKRPTYDSACYLCPGNERIGGEKNPAYPSTFVFQNDFAALVSDVPSGDFNKSNLLKAQSESGICRVVIFSPDHSLTLPKMKVEEIVKVVDLWQSQYNELAANPRINYVQIFENKGEMMGCSNPHPHGQIWAQEHIPNIPLKKTETMSQHYESNKRSLLADYLSVEQEEKTRIIYENKDFIALVPFWAIWPYEVMIVSKRHFQHIGQMNEEEKQSYAQTIQKVTQAFDKLFDCSFPYSAGIHQAPTDGKAHEEWHFHMSFYPPLLRSATVKKFMVGYEMFANPQRDITAEYSAEQLKSLIS